jgi:predicted dehydrogenase
VVYDDYKELLEKTEMDLFVNALPSQYHTQAALDAFAKGNNVLCEKPLAKNVAEFDRMVEASKQAGKLLYPFQNSRFYPFFQKICEVVNSGVLGEILHVRSHWSGFARRWDWQTLQERQGGNLYNTGPHPVDQAVILFGEEYPEVFCKMRSIQPFGGDAEDFCALTMHGKGPMIEILLSSYLAYPMGEMYNISGTLGGLTGGPKGLKWKYFDPKLAPQQKLWAKWSEDRKYCGESLPWVEETWEFNDTGSNSDGFSFNSMQLYNNLYDVLVNGAEQIIKHDQVRRQLYVIEECHRQNPLPVRD